MEAGDGKVFFAPWWWGRGFLALEDTTVTYATTDVYRPEHEIGISYLGLKDIETDLERIKAQLIVSEKDQKAQAINTEGTQETLANWKRAGDDILRDRNEEQ
jgi:dTDP-4-dehydrorhamnose 3,5-epimerase-like enzyme